MYTKRLLSSRLGELPPIQFTSVNQKCRNQFLGIIYRVIKDCGLKHPIDFCDEIRLNLGLEPLPPNHTHDWDMIDPLTKNLNDIQFLDFIDLICQMFYDYHKEDRRFEYESFVNDVENILRENGLGYKIHDRTLVKYIDEYEYKSIVAEGLEILTENGFEIPRQHILSAFELFKQNNNPDALVEITKSLESTIDILASKMRIQIEKKSGLNSKINILLQEGLCPKYNESFLNALVRLLSEASARNNEGAHSKNLESNVGDHLVQYAMDQTLSSILFLIRSYIGMQFSGPRDSKRY